VFFEQIIEPNIFWILVPSKLEKLSNINVSFAQV